MNPADSAAAALRGASLAFRNKEKLDQAQASQQQQQAARSRLPGGGSGTATTTTNGSRVMGLAAAGGATRGRAHGRSTSVIAAALAAAAAVDSGSIAPTGSLISMFERVRGGAGGGSLSATGKRVAASRPSSPPQSIGSCPEELSRRPARATMGLSKPGLDVRPPTPPRAGEGIPGLLLAKRPPSPLLANPRISLVAMTPSKPSQPKPKPLAAGHSRSKSAAAASPIPQKPKPTPLIPEPAPKAPSSKLRQPAKARIGSPPPDPLPHSTTDQCDAVVATAPKPRAKPSTPSPPQPTSEAPPLGPWSRAPWPLAPPMSRSTAEGQSSPAERASDTPLGPVSSSSSHLPPRSSAQAAPSSSSPDARKGTPATKRVLHARRVEPRPAPPLLARREAMASAPSSPAREACRRRLPNASVSTLQLDSLADAIVAGSLASARLTPHNTGSSLPPASLPKRQRSPRLLQTLRQPHGPSDEEPDRHRKGHRSKLQKGKHAHNEGSRKRWREEIRPRERKRYEALWASNRGTLLTQASPCTSSSSGLDRDVSQYVVNVVVRELWRRSRLPFDELAEIWDLVDGGGAGMLSRQEFVVGTWLVDQRLRGRKVPARVTDSVWGSANGVTARRPRGR